jgi:GAF domain-containing protein
MDRNDPSHVEHDVDFVGSLGVMQALPLGRDDMDLFLEKVAGLAAVAVAGELSCGITVRHDDSPMTAAASDETAAIVDKAQYGAGDGPCIEAMATGQVVHVRDQETDLRWGGYRQVALDRGVRSSLSLPLSVGSAFAGALNLYDRRGPDAFDAEAQHRAEVFAAQASTALALDLQFRQHERMSDQVVAALRSRSTIDQALGILMAEEQCDADTAFALLRHHSQSTNQKLTAVAARLVERATGHPASTPSNFVT